jgi:ceramide glucosyltransferase
MVHSTIRILQFVPIFGCASSIFYYLLCLWSARRFLRQRLVHDDGPSKSFPPVSILKPLKGTDPEIYTSFRSHCLQDYPQYEIIFGVSDAVDPAVASVKQLQQEFPSHAIRLVICPEILGSNVKVSNLEQMLSAASYEHMIVNDSDIRVGPDYLHRVIAPLGDDHVGMVTALYRGVAEPTIGSHLESLGISTDFCPGVLAARQLEGSLRFGLGSTLAFRRKDLNRIGGFKSIVDYLADDYELGRRIAGLGLKVVLSDVVVETHLPAYNLSGFFAHQMRWARGVRDVRLGGYIGLASTFGLLWALLNVIAFRGAAWTLEAFAAVALARLAVAIVVGKFVLDDRQILKQLWLLPVRDLIAVGIWLVSFVGHTVTWRGDRFRLKNGRLTRIENRSG